MSVLIRNNGGAALSLPTYNVILKPGDAVVVTGTAGSVQAQFALFGANSQYLEIRDVTDAPTPGLGNIDIYVDGATGNDANSGSSDSPLATFAEALRRLPPSWRAGAHIHLDAGLYVLPQSMTVGRGQAPDGSNLIVSATSSTTLATLAAGAATTASVIKGAFVAGVHRGKWIRFTSGAAAGQKSTIGDNTATDLLPVMPFTVIPAPGDTYVVEEPNVTLRTNPEGTILDNQWVAWLNVRFKLEPAPSFNPLTSMAWQNSYFAFEGCDFDCNGLLLFVQFSTHLQMSGFGAGTFPADVDPFSDLRLGSGCVFRTPPFTFGGLTLIDGASANGAVVAQNCFIALADNSSGSFGGPSYGANFTFASSILCFGSQLAMEPTSIASVLDGNHPFAPTIVLASDRAKSGTTIGNVEVKNSSGAAFIVAAGSHLSLGVAGFLSPAAPVFGAGNGTFGIIVTQMSQALIGRPLVTVTGAFGDTLVGAVPKAYVADLDPLSGFGEVDASGPTLNRIDVA